MSNVRRLATNVMKDLRHVKIQDPLNFVRKMELQRNVKEQKLLRDVKRPAEHAKEILQHYFFQNSVVIITYLNTKDCFEINLN